MKNKTLAIFGIVAYVLSVLSSATDLEGNTTVPTILIIISGIATIVFVILAVVRLWKISTSSSILLASSFILTSAQGLISLSYGSPITIFFNIVKVIYFLTTIWVIIILFKLKNNK